GTSPPMPEASGRHPARLSRPTYTTPLPLPYHPAAVSTARAAPRTGRRACPDRARPPAGSPLRRSPQLVTLAGPARTPLEESAVRLHCRLPPPARPVHTAARWRTVCEPTRRPPFWPAARDHRACFRLP